MILFLLGIAAMMLGLTWMRYSLSRLFDHRLRAVLAGLTDSPYRGFVLGICAAVLLQGSTAVSLLSVALVGSGVLSLPQSIAILLGANIGTCSTIPLMMAIPPDILTSARPYLFTALAVGLLLRRTRPLCSAVGGFCLMLEGFTLLRTASASLVAFDELTALIQDADTTPFIGIGVGILLTFVLQSASGATLLLTSLCENQLLPLTSACLIIYGNNIGSCLSSVLVSTAAPREAKMTAMANLILNLGGTLLFFPLTMPLLALASTAFSVTADRLIFLHTVFNLVSSLILLPFTRQYTAFIIFLFGRSRV